MSNTHLQYSTFCTQFDMYYISYDTNNYDHKCMELTKYEKTLHESVSWVTFFSST